MSYHLTARQKAEALADYFGMTLEDAKAQLVDMGEAEDDPDGFDEPENCLHLGVFARPGADEKYCGHCDSFVPNWLL